MSDRSLTFLVPPLPLLSRLRLLPRGVAASAGPARNGVRFGAPSFGGARWPLQPAPAGIRAMLRAAWRRHRTRSCLADLDAHLLKDIGISYAEAEAEANKPFWSA